jgi:hypothetical protein
MNFYIKDTTISSSPFIYNNVNDVVKHLEGTVKRRFNKTRAEYMQHIIELGHGYDDGDGVTFTNSLSEYFDIGVVRVDKYIRTNIHEYVRNVRWRNEMGD